MKKTPLSSGINNPPSVEMPRPGSNARLDFTLVPSSVHNLPLSKASRPPSGGRGIYRVTFFLAIPGKSTFHDELNIEMLITSGESLLQTHPEATFDVQITSYAGGVSVSFVSNSEGVLTIAQMRFHADNFEEALRLSHDAVSPVLSYWSYRYDVAIDVSGYEAIEEQSGTRRYSFGVVGRSRALDLGDEAKLLPIFRPVYSNYREALNATNVFYQVLCFYKVTEGVKRMRDGRKKALVAKGEAPTDLVEKIPDRLDDIRSDKASKDAFTPYLGKKFTWVLDQFRSVLRNAVAHLDPSGNILDADKYDDVMSCTRAIPVIKYIARRMLESELKAAGGAP
jgi:hypothetical protein